MQIADKYYVISTETYIQVDVTHSYANNLLQIKFSQRGETFKHAGTDDNKRGCR